MVMTKQRGGTRNPTNTSETRTLLRILHGTQQKRRLQQPTDQPRTPCVWT